MGFLVKKHFIITLFSLTLFACDRDISRLKELCETDGGVTIHKTVKADGYYNANQKTGFVRTLINSSYQFIEYCNHKPYAKDIITTPGCWRLEKISRNNAELCNSMIDEDVLPLNHRGYKEFRKNNCIKITKIDKPSARYGYFFEKKELDRNSLHGIFSRYEIKIMDMSQGGEISKRVSYSFYPRSESRSTKSCYHYDKDLMESVKKGLVNLTIQ